MIRQLNGRFPASRTDSQPIRLLMHQSTNQKTMTVANSITIAPCASGHKKDPVCVSGVTSSCVTSLLKASISPLNISGVGASPVVLLIAYSLSLDSVAKSGSDWCWDLNGADNISDAVGSAGVVEIVGVI